MTPWRDPSSLYPEVGVEQVPGTLSPAGDLLGVVAVPRGVPAVAVTSPTAAATSSTGCRAFGCDEPVFSPLTGRCEAHGEEDLDRLREYLDDVGRGTFEP